MEQSTLFTKATIKHKTKKAIVEWASLNGIRVTRHTLDQEQGTDKSDYKVVLEGDKKTPDRSFIVEDGVLKVDGKDVANPALLNEIRTAVCDILKDGTFTATEADHIKSVVSSYLKPQHQR